MTKRMADGLKTALQQALQMEKSATQENWAELYMEQVDELTPSKKEKPPSDFYSSDEIRKLGIRCGENCLLHKTTNIVAPEQLVLGNNVRIDGFNLISCGTGISIGNFVHIASHNILMGAAGIIIGDYCSIAAGSKIFSASDDVMGRGLVGPTVPMEKRYLHSGVVHLESHSVLAVNSVVMPGGYLSKGSTLLPFSILMKGFIEEDYAVLSGVPAVIIKKKRAEFIKLVEETENE